MRVRSTIRCAARRLAAPAYAVITCVLLGTSVARADFNYGIDVGVGHSDNISRVDVDEVDETIATIGLDLTWHERTRRLNADATVDLSYFEYLDNTYDGEVVGTADGSLTVGIIPDRFTWLFQDSFGQAQGDPFAPVTPANRENINYFTTGPDLIVRFGSASSLRLFGRYSATQYENSPLDSDRMSGGLALARRPSQNSELAFNAVTERVDFDNPLSNDFDQHSAFLSYKREGGRTELDAELGYNWLERNGAQTEGGPLVKVSVTRDVTSASTVRLSLGTQFTDAGESLRGALATQAVGGPDITATPDPFENRLASVEWLFARNRTRFSLGASWNEDRYEQQTVLDRSRMAYSASLSRRMARTLDLGVHALLNDEEFDSTGLNADELNLGASLTWRPGRIVDYALTFDRYDRSTSNDTGEYVENRVFFTVTFRPRGAASDPGRP